MANGGMQRGVYGRAESPLQRRLPDPRPLPPAPPTGRYCHRRELRRLRSGGRDLVERPWPCLQQRPVCLHPVPWRHFSVRGNWPLTPTMDDVVPYARTMNDLLEVLDVVVPTMPRLAVICGACSPGCNCPRRPKCVRLPIWIWLPRPMPSRASASGCRACLSTG